MSTCNDCIHSSVCTPYNTPNDEYPNIGDCPHFKNKADYVGKHGKWVGVTDFGNGNCIGYCSACGTTQKAEHPTALKMFHKYCRWCGAKMDGGNE
jgi:hypothetical protein